jgi:ribosome maturation factor RimP
LDIKLLKEQLKPVIEQLGYDLFDVILVKEGDQQILQIAIDNEAGIAIDDCVLVSEKLDPLLDQLDPIEGEYQLEVTSPGAERPLRNQLEIQKSIGKYVHIETADQALEGMLIQFSAEILTIRTLKNKEVKINYIDVNLIRLAIKF